MTPENMRLLYEYNDWANRQILGQAEELTAEQLREPNERGYPSIHDTLAHMVDSEWTWLDDIWRGAAAKRGGYAEFNAEDFPDLPAIQRRWSEVAAELRDFIATLTPTGGNSLDQIIVYEGDDGVMRRRPLWLLMLHVVNHSTQHRAEVAEALTSAGHSPGDLDLTYFYSLRERGEAG